MMKLRCVSNVVCPITLSRGVSYSLNLSEMSFLVSDMEEGEMEDMKGENSGIGRENPSENSPLVENPGKDVVQNGEPKWRRRLPRYHLFLHRNSPSCDLGTYPHLCIRVVFWTLPSDTEGNAILVQHEESTLICTY